MCTHKSKSLRVRITLMKFMWLVANCFCKWEGGNIFLIVSRNILKRAQRTSLKVQQAWRCYIRVSNLITKYLDIRIADTRSEVFPFLNIIREIVSIVKSFQCFMNLCDLWCQIWCCLFKIERCTDQRQDASLIWWLTISCSNRAVYLLVYYTHLLWGWSW